MPIYTRTGDTGSTSLFGGKRVLKCEELVDVYGSLDELNSWIGHVASDFTVPDVQQFLHTIQADLFTIGSRLAGWKTELAAIRERIPQIEARIDATEKELPKLTSFILPGGADLASHAHITRSICRRVERQMVALKTHEHDLDEQTLNLFIAYLNRLSDLFFMLARFINKQANVEETTWSGLPRQKSEI
ncbi:cob(I)yrinic acid a,c-diamide adenosyltransferase [Candidatus Gottesmanbacteria bacterium]|nr:cob(I)yrinic acid a,c-diamide adenosyltransferase [Candidatus Gottesmanbacteria bacterium]